MQKLKEDFGSMQEESNRQGGMIIKITQRIEVIEIKLDNLEKTFSGGLVNSSPLGDSSSEIKNLKHLLDLLRKDLSAMKEENYQKFQNIEAELDQKLDKKDLIEFERLMRERIEANEKALQKARNELRKALRSLDEKIKNIDMKATSRGPSLDREEAMLAKKPLEGWKCANCEKDLINMAGLPVDHYNWKKMPRKDGERIPMMGQGFSRMLMTLNHNSSDSQLEKRHSKTFYSPRKDDEKSVLNESAMSSRNVKVRTSLTKQDKDGSTTVENSVLPQIKKKKN